MHNIRESPRHDDSPRPQRPIQVEGGADQSQVRERLREIAQGLSAWAGLFGVQAEVVGIPEHLLEEQPGVFESSRICAAGAGERRRRTTP